MILRRLACILILLSLVSCSLQAQDRLKLAVLEDSLSHLQKEILKAGNDSARQSLNASFLNTLKTAIALPGSFSYPFDSLKKMAKLTSPDKKFRIYNWNLPLTNGTNRYYCFLQIPDKKNKNIAALIELHDRSDSIPDAEHSALGSGNWYGALYFRIIEEAAKTGMIYTLLGWEGTNPAEMQKIIEVLTFDEKNVPSFGKKIFNKYRDGENKRVIFRYSAVAAMVLRYEEQAIPKGKKWNASSRTFDEKSSKAPMIVCDRLVTVEGTENKGPLLVPAGDVYDGFLFENDRWNFVEGVDARNR